MKLGCPFLRVEAQVQKQQVWGLKVSAGRDVQGRRSRTSRRAGVHGRSGRDPEKSRG